MNTAAGMDCSNGSMTLNGKSIFVPARSCSRDVVPQREIMYDFFPNLRISKCKYLFQLHSIFTHSILPLNLSSALVEHGTRCKQCLFCHLSPGCPACLLNTAAQNLFCSISQQWTPWVNAAEFGIRAPFTWHPSGRTLLQADACRCIWTTSIQALEEYISLRTTKYKTVFIISNWGKHKMI